MAKIPPTFGWWESVASGLVLIACVTFLVGKVDFLATTTPVPATPEKALIYAGWFGNTIPTPSYVASNQAFLESQPFNGLVVYLRNLPPAGSLGEPRAYSGEEYAK